MPRDSIPSHSRDFHHGDRRSLCRHREEEASILLRQNTAQPTRCCRCACRICQQPICISRKRHLFEGSQKIHNSAGCKRLSVTIRENSTHSDALQHQEEAEHRFRTCLLSGCKNGQVAPASSKRSRSRLQVYQNISILLDQRAEVHTPS